MAPATATQAISGVSAGREAMIETVYPSISASGLGRFVGSVCDSIDVSINGVKLSALIFGLPLAPLALTGYALSKLFGEKYVLTNRTVQVRAAFGSRLYDQASLSDVDNVAITTQPGQEFFHAGDLELINDRDEVVLSLAGSRAPGAFPPGHSRRPRSSHSQRSRARGHRGAAVTSQRAMRSSPRVRQGASLSVRPLIAIGNGPDAGRLASASSCGKRRLESDRIRPPP